MAKKTKPVAPTLNYLLALRTEMETLYSAQDTQIDRLREVRELTRPVPLEDQYKLVSMEVHDPTIADEIQRVVATLTVNPPKLTVTSRTAAGDKGQTNATLREHATEEILRSAGQRIPGSDTFTAIVDGASGDGGAWHKLVFDKDTWETRYALTRKQFQTAAQFDEATEEAKRLDGQPFVWVCCDARTVYPVWQSGRLGEILEVTQRPMSATFRQYRLGQNDSGDIVSEELALGTKSVAATSSVTFLEHWDDTWVSYAVVGKNVKGDPTGQVVQQWQHGYGRLPYFFAPGLWMNHWRNRKVGWSIAEAKRFLVEYRSFLWTLHAQLAARDTLTPLFRALPDTSAPIMGDDGKPVTKEAETWTLGAIYNGLPGEQLAPIPFAPTAASLKEEVALVSEAIEKLESPRVNANIGSGLEGAGFAINQILAEARIRHDPIAQSVERSMEDLTRFMWSLIKNKVKEKVWVYRSGGDSGWIGLGPEDIEAPVSIEWKLDPALPSGKLVEVRMWTERLKDGTAHLDQVIEALGDNPDEIRRGRAIDRMRQSEWYQRLLDMTILQELGRGDLLAMANEAQQVAMSGQLAAAPSGMGTQGIPDMGQAAAQGVVNSPNTDTSPGVVVPQQSAVAGAGLA